MPLQPQNEIDKQRFERMKRTEEEHGRNEQEATEIAARETKTMREREGRSKEDRERPAPK